MKLFAVFALNVVTVTMAILVYDVIRADPEVPAAAPEAVDRIEDQISERLDALESAERRTRRSVATDPRVLERIAALEDAYSAPRLPETAPDAAGGEVEKPSASRSSDTEKEPTDDDVARFRRLQAAVKRADTIAKNAPRIDAALDALPLNLTDAQRANVHAAYADFQPRVGAIWGEAKATAQETAAAGGQVDRATIVADTTALIESEFAETLSQVVAPGDAAMVAGALLGSGK